MCLRVIFENLFQIGSVSGGSRFRFWLVVVEMNQPDRFEKFVVPEGVQKVTYEQDTKVPNAGTIIVQREDHTIGNLMRMQLHRDERVIFSGYRMPHPLQHETWVKVQTDGSETPLKVFVDAVDDLAQELEEMKDGFMSAYQIYLDNKPKQQQQQQQQSSPIYNAGGHPPADGNAF